MSNRSFMGGFGKSGRGRGNPFSKGKTEQKPSTPENSTQESQSTEENIVVPEIEDTGSSASLTEQFFDSGELGAENDEQFDFFNQNFADEEGTHKESVSSEPFASEPEISLTEQFLSGGQESPTQNVFEDSYPEPTPAYSGQKSNEEARVFLRYSEDAPKGDPILGALISLFRLNVYGASKLTKRALYAMEMASVILTVIFCFDLALWFVLFNMILSKGAGSITIGAMTPIAGFLGLCMATVSIIFEASIFTSDLSKIDYKNGIAMSGRVLLVIIAAFITAAPFHVLVFNGPISKRVRIEQGIEKGLYIAGELQDSESTLVNAICNNDGQAGVVKEDRDEVVAKSSVLRSEIQSLEDQIEDLRYEKYKDRSRSYDRALERRPNGAKINTILGSLSWAKDDCTTYYMSDKAGKYSLKDAKIRCKSIRSTREAQRDFLHGKIAQVEVTLKKKKQEAGFVSADADKIDETRIEMAALKDSCASEVAKMESWYEDGLKGYSRKLTSSSAGSNIFTLSNCYDTKDELKSCGSYRDGLTETSLEKKVSSFLDEKLQKQLTNLDAAKTAQITSNPENADALGKAFKVQSDALHSLTEKKKQICSEWCFEYRDPNFWEQIGALDHLIYGKKPMWPEGQNHTLKDCQIMIDTLRIPTPDNGRCMAYSPDVDVVTNKAKGDFINAVIIKNLTHLDGVENEVGDQVECSVRLKQGEEDTLYEIRWVINGAPKGNMGVFSKNKRAAASLDTNNGIYKDDSISCQVTPLNDAGEIGKIVSSNTITMSKGTDRPDIVGVNEDADKMRAQYWLVTFIGMFIPLVSLLFKLVAPKDLKDYYSVKHQGKDTSKTLRKIIHPNSPDEGDEENDWDEAPDLDYQSLYEGEHPDDLIARNRTEQQRLQARKEAAQNRRSAHARRPQARTSQAEPRNTDERSRGTRSGRGNSRNNKSRMK